MAQIAMQTEGLWFRSHMEKPSMAVCSYNPSIVGRRRVVLEIHWSPNAAKTVSIWFSERMCLKDKGQRELEEGTIVSLCPSRACTQVYTSMCLPRHMHTHVHTHAQSHSHTFTHMHTHTLTQTLRHTHTIFSVANEGGVSSIL